MLLTITTTHRPATDLGYLLHKHPERVQLAEYVNDRPYVASSFLSVALVNVFKRSRSSCGAARAGLPGIPSAS